MVVVRLKDTIHCDYPTKNVLICKIKVKCGYDSAVHRDKNFAPNQEEKAFLSCMGDLDSKSCPSLDTCYRDKKVYEYVKKGVRDLDDSSSPGRGGGR